MLIAVSKDKLVNTEESDGCCVFTKLDIRILSENLYI